MPPAQLCNGTTGSTIEVADGGVLAAVRAEALSAIESGAATNSFGTKAPAFVDNRVIWPP